MSWAGFEKAHQNKPVKQLIFYGRPEAHATRNHFGTFILGLRLAIQRKYFAGYAWEFVSIGSLAYEDYFPIAEGYKKKILCRMPYAEYTEFLQTGDVVSF